MIIVTPLVYDDKNIPVGVRFSDLPLKLQNQSELIIERGMVLKNRKGLPCHVGEHIIEENEHEIVIRVKKIKDYTI